MIAVEVRQWRRLADGSNRGSSCISSDSFSGASSDIMNKRGGERAGGGRPGGGTGGGDEADIKTTTLT